MYHRATMSYRALPPEEPLIVACSPLIQAFDPRDGALIWQQVMEGGGGMNRVVLQGNRVVVASGERVQVFERATGALVGAWALPFVATGAVAQGPVLVVAGPRGMACIRDGRLAWLVRPDREATLFGEATWAREVDGACEPLAAWAGAYDAMGPALVLGADVAWPDH